jgi:hypothetical protein
MCSDSNLDIMVLLKCQSKGSMNNFITQDAYVIKERVMWGGQVLLKRQLTEYLKLSLAAPGNLCGEPVES